MGKLIRIQANELGENCVSARELHKGLEIKSKFTDWIKNRISKYGFEENLDFILVTKTLETNNPKNPTTKETDYIITIDVAKELCMVENSEIGRQFRKYFIECEKKLKEAEKTIKYYEKKNNFNDISPLLMETKIEDSFFNNFTNNAIRKEVERVIKEIGMPITQIARRINMSDSHISNWRNGNINFSEEKLNDILSVLDKAKYLL